MEALAPDTIRHVDAMASAYLDDHWNPKTPETREAYSRLELVSHDLNLLDQPTLGPDTPALPGRDEAMYLVLTDLAMKASALMNSARQDELTGMRLVDPSIALDPRAFDDTAEEKQAETARMNAERASSLTFHGSPEPALFDRGPLKPEVADRISSITLDLVDAGSWKMTNTQKSFHQANMHADRLARLERNRRDVADPELRAAYDLLHNDHALKAAGIVAKALRTGEVKHPGLSWEDTRLLRDPHNPDRLSGLVMQASGLTADQPASAKGREETVAQAPARSSIER